MSAISASIPKRVVTSEESNTLRFMTAKGKAAPGQSVASEFNFEAKTVVNSFLSTLGLESVKVTDGGVASSSSSPAEITLAKLVERDGVTDTTARQIRGALETQLGNITGTDTDSAAAKAGLEAVLTKYTESLESLTSLAAAVTGSVITEDLELVQSAVNTLHDTFSVDTENASAVK